MRKVTMAKKVTAHTGSMYTKNFFILFVTNSLLVFLMHSFFPKNIVLGTEHITLNWALFHAVGTLTVINTLAIPIVHEFENARGKMFDSKEWTATYLILNFVGLWVISRFAEQLGLGISSWKVVLAMAIVLDIVQGIVMMAAEKIRTSS